MLVEADRPEVVSHAAVVVHDDLRGVGGEVDADLADHELAVQVTVVGGVVVERLFARLVGRLEQRFALVQREAARHLHEVGVAGAFAEQLDVARGHLQLRSLLDLVAGHPGGPFLGQRALHHHSVIAVGLQRLLDLVGGLVVQPADAHLVEVLVLARRLDLEVGEGVLAQLAAQAVELDAQRLGGDGGPRRRNSRRRRREHDHGGDGQRRPARSVGLATGRPPGSVGLAKGRADRADRADRRLGG